MSKPVFGSFGGACPGDLFASRQELALRGQHRPLRSGVCGTAALGTESIVLADEYEDDEIHDDYFWYAGRGGRHPKTGQQVADQHLDARNRPLARSAETGGPVRVFRRIADSPADWQFRYEGLWHVVESEYVVGISDFLVWRFRFEPWRKPAS